MSHLQVENLTKYFGGLKAVSHLGFEVAEGEILGLIGPNGAGKSTVLNLINGFLDPHEGRLLLDGVDIMTWSTARRARHGMARVFQLDVIFESLSVRQSVEVGSHVLRGRVLTWSDRGPSGRRRRARAIERHVEEVLDRVGLAEDTDTPVTSLPHGKKRLLGLAVALASEPRIVLLDEPLTGMNAGETSAMLGVIKHLNAADGITFLIVEHNMQAVMSLCSNLCVINFGERIAYGPPVAVANDPLVIDAYLGAPDIDGFIGELRL
ncbi:MAG: ABC transporter ATP-binding protein [Actinobacteria bacterium]|nr:ABC transporter ATP-binding protein [Actinomycetota bacterium]